MLGCLRGLLATCTGDRCSGLAGGPACRRPRPTATPLASLGSAIRPVRCSPTIPKGRIRSLEVVELLGRARDHDGDRVVADVDDAAGEDADELDDL